MKYYALVFLLAVPLIIQGQNDYPPLYCDFCKNVSAEISGTNVNVRSGPSVSEKSLAKLNTGDKISILNYGKSEIIGDKYGLWLNITFMNPATQKETEGWVFGAFVYYKVSFVATYTDFRWGDMPHFYFTRTDSTHLDFIDFRDDKSPVKWKDLTISRDEVDERPNPEYLDKKFRLTVEYLDAYVWLSGWTDVVPTKGEVLTKVELLD